MPTGQKIRDRLKTSETTGMLGCHAHRLIGQRMRHTVHGIPQTPMILDAIKCL